MLLVVVGVAGITGMGPVVLVLTGIHGRPGELTLTGTVGEVRL